MKTEKHGTRASVRPSQSGTSTPASLRRTGRVRSGGSRRPFNTAWRPGTRNGQTLDRSGIERISASAEIPRADVCLDSAWLADLERMDATRLVDPDFDADELDARQHIGNSALNAFDWDD